MLHEGSDSTGSEKDKPRGQVVGKGLVIVIIASFEKDSAAPRMSGLQRPSDIEAGG
jgi:hypothetical protein